MLVDIKYHKTNMFVNRKLRKLQNKIIYCNFRQNVLTELVLCASSERK